MDCPWFLWSDSWLEVKEAKERVSIAIRNSGFRIPPQEITINLSPADFSQSGNRYDLAIAAAILGAVRVTPTGNIWRVVCFWVN